MCQVKKSAAGEPLFGCQPSLFIERHMRERG